jgi:hypothetical protein
MPTFLVLSYDRLEQGLERAELLWLHPGVESLEPLGEGSVFLDTDLAGPASQVNQLLHARILPTPLQDFRPVDEEGLMLGHVGM